MLRISTERWLLLSSQEDCADIRVPFAGLGGSHEHRAGTSPRTCVPWCILEDGAVLATGGPRWHVLLLLLLLYSAHLRSRRPLSQRSSRPSVRRRSADPSALCPLHRGSRAQSVSKEHKSIQHTQVRSETKRPKMERCIQPLDTVRAGWHRGLPTETMPEFMQKTTGSGSRRIPTAHSAEELQSAPTLGDEKTATTVKSFCHTHRTYLDGVRIQARRGLLARERARGKGDSKGADIFRRSLRLGHNLARPDQPQRVTGEVNRTQSCGQPRERGEHPCSE